MSMLSHQIEQLKDLRYRMGTLDKHNPTDWTLINGAIDTIEALSDKLAVVNMERSERYYNGGWKPISEYDREKYDWVLIKYFDGEEECIPQVAELRSDGKWHVSAGFDGDFTIPSCFDVKYFFDMQQLDKE